MFNTTYIIQYCNTVLYMYMFFVIKEVEDSGFETQAHGL